MNRFSFFLSSIVMLTLSFSASADNYLRGDNNLDGKVDISDVTALINYILTDHWTSGSYYDDGFWVVFTDKYGNEEYHQLDQYYSENTVYTTFSADGVFNGLSPFHFRIDGVDYGADFFLTDVLLGNPFVNPLKPGRNNYMIPAGLYHIGIVIDNGAHDHDYYVFVQPLYVVD